MNLKAFTQDHYPILLEWWKEHKHPIIPLTMLSPCGLVGYNSKNEASAMCFMYFVQSCDIAQLSWTTTNPQVSAKDRYLAVDACVKGLIAVAKHNNRTNIMCLSDSSGLNKIYGKNGLKELKDHKLLYGKLGVL